MSSYFVFIFPATDDKMAFIADIENEFPKLEMIKYLCYMKFSQIKYNLILNKIHNNLNYNNKFLSSPNYTGLIDFSN